MIEEAIAHERERIEHSGGCYMMSVVHWDEKQLHAHLFALDPVKGRVNHLHPGVAAKQAFADDLRNAALSKKDRNSGGNRAYCDAMREWQDTLHNEVFKVHGLLRTGPRRERLSRADWQQSKTAAAERMEDAERQQDMRVRAQELVEFETTMVKLRAEDLEAQRSWNVELEKSRRDLRKHHRRDRSNLASCANAQTGETSEGLSPASRAGVASYTRVRKVRSPR